MVLAIMLAVLASFLWSITNHTDRFLVNGVDRAASSIKTLMVFSTLIAGIMAATIWLCFNGWQIPSINWPAFTLIFGSAGCYVVASYLYFRALDGNETSRIVVLYQLIPMFSYVLGLIFLHETLNLRQIGGSLIILVAAVIISINFRQKAKTNQRQALLFMLLSCLAFALYYLLFDLAREQSSYDSCAFWYQIGMVIFGLGFIIVPSFRNNFTQAIRRNGKIYVPLNLMNELLNSAAVLMSNYAVIALPLALANVMNGLQPAFTFILGVIGMKLMPKYFEEDLSRPAVIQKLGCIVLIGIGLAVIFV